MQGSDVDDSASGCTSSSATLVLDADGTFEIATPCLVRRGSYVERGDDRFVFSATDDQAQPCEEADDELAAVVEAVLVQGATVEIDGNDMAMWAGEAGLGLRAVGER